MNNESIPELTIGQDSSTEKDTIPTLEVAESTGVPDLLKRTEAPAVPQDSSLDINKLEPAEQNAVKQFLTKINVGDTNLVLSYGSAAQTKISTFSENILSNVRAKDSGQIGEILTNLVVKIKDFNGDLPEKKSMLGNIFSNLKKQAERLIARYDKISVDIDKIQSALESNKNVLMKDIVVFDGLYKKNVEYFKELTLYIIAGEEKLKEVRATILKQLVEKARESNDPMDVQNVNDMQNMLNRFEKKLHDLKLSRVLSIQMGPQIRLIQNNDAQLVEKIQSSILNTIPLWKSQMVIALGLNNSQRALQAQKAVSDMTNELLTKNSEMLKMGTIEIARESERGIVDIETIQKTNANLISTIDEVLKIQQEGSVKRAAAEQELQKIESDLKAKLLEIKR